MLDLVSFQVISNLRKIQQALVQQEPRLEPYLVSDKKLHLTLHVFRMDDTDDTQVEM